MNTEPAQAYKPPEPQKPSIWRSLKFGVVTYVTVVSRNYWHSFLIHIVGSFRSRKSERHESPPSKKTEHIKNEMAGVIGDAKDHGKQSFSIMLEDPLAIFGAISATYVHYKNSRTNYNTALERRAMLAEQREQAKAQQEERRLTTQEQRTRLKEEVRAEVKREVFEELQNYGIIPHSAITPKTKTPPSALSGATPKGTSSFADKYAPRSEVKELTSAGQKGR